MKSQSNYRIVLSFSSLLLIQGCSFSPQTHNISPYFDGTLTLQGEAISQARILLSLKPDDIQCNQAEKSTQTDKNGKFSLKPITRKSSYVPFINYHFVEWTLCAEHEHQRYLLTQNNRYTSEHQNESIYINCDLAMKKKSAHCKIDH